MRETHAFSHTSQTFRDLLQGQALLDSELGTNLVIIP